MTILEAISPTARALLRRDLHKSQPAPFDRAMTAVLFPQRMRWQERALIVAGSEPDERLQLLSSRLTAVGGNISCLKLAEPADRREAELLLRATIADLAAFALIWATTGQRNYVRGCRAIAAERERQRQLFQDGKISFDCASPIVDARRKFRVLFEECGEVAHAIDQIENHGLAAGNLNKELTQCAAVCVAWMEALEVSGPSSVVSGKGGAR